MALVEPIVRGIPNEQNGKIRFLGTNPTGEGFDHIFSFVYYIVEGASFEGSKYSIGMKAYLDMIHTPEFPFSCGMIVYTNPTTLPFLQKAFPFETYPKLTLAVVDWPLYATPTGIDVLVLRCLRFQAVDHYPTKYVHMRDADTLFVLQINEENDITKLVFDWERNYLQMIPDLETKGYQIVIGTYYDYRGDYHKNIPYPVEFSFPVRTAPEFKPGAPILNRDRHLYLQSKELRYEDRQVVSALQEALSNKDYDGAIFQYYLEKIVGPAERDTTLKYLAELKELDKKFKASANYSEKEALMNRRDEISKRIVQEFKDQKLRTKQTQPIPFFEYFEKEYMFKPTIGIFAGFVSVLKNRSGIENFWRLCIDYLLPRYRWVSNKERNDTVLSNQLIKRNKNDSRFLGYGKDERMLIFGPTPAFLDKIFFFPVTYMTKPDPGLNMSFFTPNVYFSKIKLNKQKNYYSLDKTFERQSEAYRKWLEEIHRKYPTEEAYLNAINANVERLLIPYENLPKSKSNKKPLSPYNKFTKANRKATVRRGGKRKTQRKH